MTTDPTPLPGRGRWTRVAAAVIVLVVVLAGTVFGSDDDFPVGPFHMYSSRTNPNSISRQLRVQVVLASGQVAGILEDLPSCAELIESIVRDAIEHLRAASALVQ